jgi:tRNA(fMet)-specific endonuclease VapC
MIIADSDVLIDYLQRRGANETVRELLGHRALQTTVISRFELLSGAKDAAYLSRVRELLSVVSSLPLNEAAADRASEIRKTLERGGNPIAMADCLIAGIVADQGGILLTRNRRHFERVPGLRLV